MKKPEKRKRAYITINKTDEGNRQHLRNYKCNNYSTNRWKKASKAFRDAHPICELCRRRGIITLAEVVDHIIPVEVCSDFWDQNNWQSLCRRCNNIKGNKDKKLIQKARFDRIQGGEGV